MSIKLITDSVADIPADLVKQYDITVLPLTVNFSDHSYIDGVEIDSASFFDRLATVDELPTTSQVTTGVFMEKFRELLTTEHHYLGIFMSSKLSGTYGAAVQALSEIGSDRIVVMDSKLVSFTLGQVVLALAERADDVDSLQALQAKAEKMIAATRSRYIIDTLVYLKKGGRLSSAEAFFGSMLNIKPILHIEDGKLKAVNKARGRKKAVQAILDWIDEESYDLNNKYVSLFHAVEPDYLAYLRQAVIERFPSAIITLSTVGAVVGTHSGPGCVALSFINIDKDVI